MKTLDILGALGVVDAGALAAHWLLCGVLIWSVFCRSSGTDRHTVRRSIRWAFGALGTAASMAAAAPFLGWRPDIVHLAMLAGICAVQLATARYWLHGVPPQFIKPECRPYTRRTEDCT